MVWCSIVVSGGMCHRLDLDILGFSSVKDFIMDQSKILSVNAKPTPVIKGSIVSTETSSKGQKVVWQRLEKSIKDDANKITTSKNYVEYAADRPVIKIRESVQWLVDNAELNNVQEWFVGLFDTVNRPLLAEAGAGGLQSANLIGDIESLVAHATLEARRGRAATRLSADQWKVLSPLLAEQIFDFFHGTKNIPEAPAKSLTNKYLNIARGVLVAFQAVGEDAHNKLDEMLEYAFINLVQTHSDLESLFSFMIATSAKNRETYAIADEADYGY